MNTLKSLSGRTTRRLNQRLAAKASRFKFPPEHRITAIADRSKPRQATILRRTTSRQMNYLLDHDLIDLTRGDDFSNLVTAKSTFNRKLPTGLTEVVKIDDGSATCGV